MPKILCLGWNPSYLRNEDVVDSIHMNVVLGCLLYPSVIVVVVCPPFVVVVVKLHTNKKSISLMYNVLLNH